MKLYRVRVEFDVMVVAESPWAAVDRASRIKPGSDATITACPATSAADLFGRDETIPYLTDEAARIPDDHERTCAEWLDYLASLPPSTDAAWRDALWREYEEAQYEYEWAAREHSCDRCAGRPDAECRVLCFQCWTEYVPHVEERRVRAAPERAESERRDVFGRAIDMSVEALRQRNEEAHEMVTALCKPRGTEGSREWIMSIPARPDDPDLVIGQALNDAKRLIDRLATPPPSTDALWREYATARTDVVNADRDLRECAARAAEHRYPPAWACQDYVRRSDEAWHRLDAAVRALAAHRPGPPGVAGDDGAPERAADGHADGEG